MAIIDDVDIQTFLPIDKLNLDNLPDDVEAAKLDAERIIRGYLATVFQPATLASWASPETTPGQIRAIAGRFAASRIYRTRYSEDDLDDPEFAQVLYNEAMNMLNGVLTGKIVLDDVDDTASTFDNTFFYPNSTTEDPYFTMVDRY